MRLGVVTLFLATKYALACPRAGGSKVLSFAPVVCFGYDPLATEQQMVNAPSGNETRNECTSRPPTCED